MHSGPFSKGCLRIVSGIQGLGPEPRESRIKRKMKWKLPSRVQFIGLGLHYGSMGAPKEVEQNYRGP